MSSGIYFNSGSKAERNARKREKAGEQSAAVDAELQRRQLIRQNWEGCTARGFRAEEAANDPANQVRDQYEKTVSDFYTQQTANIFNSPDPLGVFVNPGQAPPADLEQFNTINFEAFTKTRPYFRCDANVQAFKRYFAANNATILPASVFTAAYDRLLALGLIVTNEQHVASIMKPAAAQAPRASIEIDGVTYAGNAARRVIDQMHPDLYKHHLRNTAGFRENVDAILSGQPLQSAQPAAAPQPKGEQGWGPDGQPLWLSNHAVDKLSPDEYKAFTRGSVQQNPYVFRGQR